MKPMTEKHLAILRRHMVEIVEMHFDLASDEIGRDTLDPALRQAMLEVPRHVFVPSSLAAFAYQDGPLPIGFDKTISQPFIGALMLQLAGVGADLRVLEIGTGLGYQAAVLAKLARLDKAFRGRKAKLTPDRVGYMVHPDWVSRPSKRPPAKLWRPEVPTLEGLKATAAWYREQGWL
jgi:hypothetical protein